MSIFTEIQKRKIKSATFDLSQNVAMTTKMGKLTPTFVLDTLPGDVINLRSSQMVRYAPLIAPVMHSVNVYTHYFYVPTRLVWKNFPLFMTGGEKGDEPQPVAPFLNIDNIANSSLHDYLGASANQEGSTSVPTKLSSIPHAMYQFIFNEYYRDQQLQDPVEFELADGDNDTNKASLSQLHTRAWQKDYFTSALPSTQKGPEATIPLGTTAPLIETTANTVINTLTGLPSTGTAGNMQDNVGVLSTLANSQTAPAALRANVDLTAASAASINDLRKAFRLQEYLELNNRAGSRYTEWLQAQYGVKSSDARLQRPEYLGGGKSPVQFSEVLQTSGSFADSTIQTTPQGNMAGHGINAGINNGFKYFCEEHGYIIGLTSVMPKPQYMQGVDKHLTRFDPYDYGIPIFGNLGEQPIKNQEIYNDTVDGSNDETFGYTPRYAEYKFMQNKVHGDFKGNLDFWHMARKFDTRPALNTTFISSKTDLANITTRIFAVTDPDIDNLYCQIYNNVTAKRRLPYFGTPTI